MKRAIITLLAIVMTFGTIGVVGAQGGPPPQQPIPRAALALSSVVYQAAADAVGLTVVDMIQEATGQSLNDYLVAKGADPVAVAATARGTAETAINDAVANGVIEQDQADQILANLGDSIARIMEHPVPNVDQLRFAVQLEVIVLQTTADALGMSLLDLYQATQPGQTLSELIVANGGDPVAIAATAKANATTDIETALNEGRITQEQADEMLTNLDDSITRIMERPLPRPQGDRRPGDRGDGRGHPQMDLLQVVADELGMSPEDVLAELQSGKTLREVIVDNGGDVTVVEQALIDALTANIGQRVGNLLDQRWDRGQGGNRGGGQGGRGGQGGDGPGQGGVLQ